jgi:hypothetical protein
MSAACWRGVDVQLYFYDATFITHDRSSKEWVRGIALELIERGIAIPFRCFIRADSFNDGDDELIILLKNAGLVSVFVGFEAASDTALSGFDKGATAADNWTTVRLLKKHSLLGATNGFIMFTPYSTFPELRANATFLLETGQASFWNLTQRVQLFPGVKLLSVLERDRLLISNTTCPEVFGYRFVDARVETLANALDCNDHPLIRQENSFVRYVKNQVSYVSRLLANIGEVAAQVESARARVDHDCHKIDELNVNAFGSFVELAERGWDASQFQAVKTVYYTTLNSALETLKADFGVFLDVLNQDDSEA